MSLLKAVQLQIQPYYIEVTAPFTNHEDCCTLLEDLSFNEAIFFPGLKWPKSNSCFSVQTVLCCILGSRAPLGTRHSCWIYERHFCLQCNMALKSLVSNSVSDGQHSHDGHSTCLADGHHGHAFGPMASSFTAFFPDAVAPHHSDHFLPSIEPETVHQGDAAHLDQFDQSLLATRRPKTYVSFHKEEEKKEGEWAWQEHVQTCVV